MSKLEEIISFQNSLHSFLSWFLRPESAYLDANGGHAVSMIASQIASGYNIFDSSVFQTQSHAVKTEKFVPEDYLRRDPEYLKPLVKLYNFVNSRLKNYVSHFFLHGSMATLDYSKGWSDVDTFVIVKEATLKNPKDLVELRRLSFLAHEFLYQIDPLQHHGLIFAAETDLKAYPSCYLPPVIFKYALSMLDDKREIKFCLRDAEAEVKRSFKQRINILYEANKTGVLRHHAYRGEYLQDKYRNVQNAMYQMKYFLGQFMLFPAQLLELKGKGCYKRESFDICRPLFSEKAWLIVVKASQVRTAWPQREKFPYRGNAIPSWVQEVIGENYFRDAIAFAGEILQICEKELNNMEISL